ncbi:MAG: ATP-grasp domain-containing protein [Candidatus Fimimonas sp.]
MNILLIYGGKSCEHDISIITACLAKGYFDGNVYSAYLTVQNECYLVPKHFTPKQHKETQFKNKIVFIFGKKQIGIVRKNKIKTVEIDVVVNCCHGRCGEDGAISALCNFANLPLVGSNLISAALTMDKYYSKLVLNGLGFPTVEGIAVKDTSAESMENVEKLGYPLIVKPCTLGSSIGISLCKNREQLKNALEIAFLYDDCVLCEKALTDFYELNCSAMRSAQGETETSAVDRPYTTHDILTFQDKYIGGEKFVEQNNQEVDGEIASQVKQMTAQIFEKLSLGGVVRVDYLVCEGKIFVNEINSIPGSLAYSLWKHKYSPQQFGAILLHNAILSYKQSESKRHEFTSDVLKGGGRKK